MILAVLDELVSIVIAPRTKQRIVKGIHPLLHRFERQGQGRGIGDLALLDACKLAAKLRQLWMPNRSNETLEFRIDLEGSGALHRRADLDDLHFLTRHCPVV